MNYLLDKREKKRFKQCLLDYSNNKYVISVFKLHSWAAGGVLLFDIQLGDTFVLHCMYPVMFYDQICPYMSGWKNTLAQKDQITQIEIIAKSEKLAIS